MVLRLSFLVMQLPSPHLSRRRNSYTNIYAHTTGNSNQQQQGDALVSDLQLQLSTLEGYSMILLSLSSFSVDELAHDNVACSLKVIGGMAALRGACALGWCFHVFKQRAQKWEDSAERNIFDRCASKRETGLEKYIKLRDMDINIGSDCLETNVTEDAQMPLARWSVETSVSQESS